MRRHTLRAVLLTLLLTAGAAAGIATAAEALFSSVDQLLPSASAGLLPPITAEGRVGWACEAERRARAATMHDADLPAVP